METTATTVTPVIPIEGVTLEPRPAAWLPPSTAAGPFHVERAFLAKRLGLSKLGVNVAQVDPGKTAYPFHSHRVNDELFFILAGRGELRLGEHRHAVKEGDLIGCPAGGPQTAHQIINTGSVPLRYLSFSSELDPDICEYPDSKKVGVWVGEFSYLTRGDRPADYWDGE